MDGGISFVVSTTGMRDHLVDTVNSLHRVGAAVGDYEVIIVGNIEKIEGRNNEVLIPDIIAPPPAPPRFVWRRGLAEATKEWTACVADDMKLDESWARAFLGYDPGDAQIIWGRIRRCDGTFYPDVSIVHKALTACVRRELWSSYPLRECWGEDALWGVEMRVRKVPWRLHRDLVWQHDGEPSVRGGIGKSYRYDGSMGKEYNKQRGALAKELRPLLRPND